MELKEIRDPNLGTLLAFYIPKGFESSMATEFYTDLNSNFQVGFMKRDLNSPVNAHFHTEQIRTIQGTSEALIFRSGKALAKIFCNSQNFISEFEIHPGDILIFFSGGHSIEFQEQTTFIEIKQGPYSNCIDKVYFNAST